MFDMVTHQNDRPENIPCINQFSPYICDNALVNQTRCGADSRFQFKNGFRKREIVNLIFTKITQQFT